MKKIVKAIALFALALALVSVASAAEEKQVCPCCGENMDDIQWKALPADKTLPAGHYRVTKDGQMLRSYTTSRNATIDLNGYNLTTRENERAFYVYGGTLTILDTVGSGTISATGAIDDNGGLFRVGKGTTLNIYGGTYTANELPAERKGGIMRVEGTVNMYGGTLTGGKTHHHGGNVNISNSSVFNLYGGTVSNGETQDAGRGGNFYLTEKSELNIYGGTVSGGQSAGAGGNIFAYRGSYVNIYGGTVIDGYGKEGGNEVYVIGSRDDRISTLNIFGGIVGSGENSFLQHAETNPIRIYNGSIGLDPTPYLADCACLNKEGDRYIVWNSGHGEQTCDESCPMETAAEFVAKLYTGTHDYVPLERNTAICTICDSRYHSEAAVAVANGKICTDLSKATGNVQLLADVAMGELLVQNMNLDLNGYTLEAPVVTAVNGNICDSTGGLGLLKTSSLALAEENTNLPLQTETGYRFSSLTPDTTLERLDDDTVRIRFIFEEKAAQTQIDDLVLAGNTDISVQLYLTWTKDGVKKARTYVCDPALLYKYAQKWDGRRFVATITGVDAVSDLTCTVKLSANGVTYSDTTLKNYEPIKNILSWEKINSYPIKTSDMTVEEMRQLCVDFFEYSKTFLWTPDASVEYLRNKNDSNDSMHQGTIYGGMPYVGSASGSPYRYMDYVNPETGLLDMQKFLPAMAEGGVLDMADLIYFGSQCAKTAGLGWGRVINSANYRSTMYLVPANGVILLGDIAMDETKAAWSENYRTTTVCKENGKQTMFEAYAQLQKADGMVQYTTAGHVIMAYSDAVVVRNPDGTINGDESYVMIIHQAQKWTDQENALGDQYQMKASVNSKSTFASMYSSGYIPFTFAEFVSGDPVEETTITLTQGENVLLSGTVREEDRTLVADHTLEEMTFTDLCSLRVDSNYGVTDAYIIVYNARGQELYKHAVYNSSSVKYIKMAASGDQVTTWEYGKVESGKTYRAELVVQLTTGERPTIWSGDLIF